MMNACINNLPNTALFSTAQLFADDSLLSRELPTIIKTRSCSRKIRRTTPERSEHPRRLGKHLFFQQSKYSIISIFSPSKHKKVSSL